MNVLVTGCAGLIGSAAVTLFDALGLRVVGVENNSRRTFFGPGGDISRNLDHLHKSCRNFTCEQVDIRDQPQMQRLFSSQQFDLVIHAAGQPSHEWSADHPAEDFQINAMGTLNILESCRVYCPEAVFIFTSTNKVYGDRPNRLPLRELATRWDFDGESFFFGIPETLSLDQSLHTPYGASKIAADIMVQEYARYYGLRAGVFRLGCVTGPRHTGVSNHGFLNHLVRIAMGGERYTIVGYGGKQVRDQLHASDLAAAMWAFAQHPNVGEVYNLGGGKENAASILEYIAIIESIANRRMEVSFSDTPRRGDHICYYSDLRKFRSHYPDWSVDYSVPSMIEQMMQASANS